MKTLNLRHFAIMRYYRLASELSNFPPFSRQREIIKKMEHYQRVVTRFEEVNNAKSA